MCHPTTVATAGDSIPDATSLYWELSLLQKESYEEGSEEVLSETKRKRRLDGSGAPPPAIEKVKKPKADESESGDNAIAK
jgi:hypothetical protein